MCVGNNYFPWLVSWVGQMVGMNHSEAELISLGKPPATRSKLIIMGSSHWHKVIGFTASVAFLDHWGSSAYWAVRRTKASKQQLSVKQSLCSIQVGGNVDHFFIPKAWKLGRAYTSASIWNLAKQLVGSKASGQPRWPVIRNRLLLSNTQLTPVGRHTTKEVDDGQKNRRNIEAWDANAICSVRHS